ncbi:MAG: AbrB/MazE/SpoVT family DNA-binding domain-containing protein [bacterium]|nr:AbrB/MazE/SpoVT family DNA-binding domain-containing protein [bacterium]
MNIASVTTKGQIVIPFKIRQKLNIRKGTKLYIEERDNEIILKPITITYFDKLAGSLQTNGKLTKTLLEKRGKEKEA